MRTATYISLLLGALATCVSGGAPRKPTHVLHEKRHEHIHSRPWKRSVRMDSEAIIPVRIGLRQQNLHTIYDLLMEVSHPESSTYGQHWTAQEVHDMFAPSEDATRSVLDWLVASGVDESSIWGYENKGWLAFDIPAWQAEELFLAEYHEFEHAEAPGEHVKIGCDEYHVPRHISHHIDYITPGVVLSPPVFKSKVKRHIHHKHRRGAGQASHRTPLPVRDVAPLSNDLSSCWGSINMTIPCIRALYDIPVPSPEVHANRTLLGVYDVGDSWYQREVDQFYKTYAPYVPQGTAPIFVSVDGGNPKGDRLLYAGEVVEDVQITTSLTYPQQITLYTIGDEYHERLTEYDNGRDLLLDAFDGSYCNKTAYGITGDSPRLDTHYPDPKDTKGFQGPNMCGAYTPRSVLSSSMGSPEHRFPPNYLRRQCDEWGKLGLQGVSLLFASGDDGVSAFGGHCLGENGTVFEPEETCPYLTVVGGTRLWDHQIPGVDRESAMWLTPAVKHNVTYYHTSGGGFSNVFPVPAYQQSAIDSYFANYDPGYPYYIANYNATNIGENGGLYNRAGRGSPDVAAIGRGGIEFYSGEVLGFSGTSLSAPVFASMIALVNGERAAINKSAVGFLNPVFYSHPEIFNDVVNGTNPGCGTPGFTAVPCWDPVTGLGSVQYPKLLELFLSLP